MKTRLCITSPVTGLLLSMGLVLAIILVAVAPAHGQQEGTRNVAFIFDTSGSMYASLEGTTRLEIAKDAIINLSGQIDSGTNASLWVYGHRLPQSEPAASCQDIEQVIPLGTVNPNQFADVVSNLDAIGYTPISSTLEMAASTLPPGENNTIILISDSEETCAGNPCAVAEALHAANVGLVVNTIGFAADEVTRQQLQCIAEVTGGVYLDAPGADELNAALIEVASPSGSIRIVDPAGNVLPDVSFSVAAAGTYAGTARLPTGIYDVHVRVDPVVEQQVQLEPGAVADIVVTPIEIGTVALVDPQGTPLTDISLSIIDPTTNERLGTRNGSVNVPPGSYVAEIRTLIPFQQNVEVVNGETTEIVVDTTSGTIVSVDQNGTPVTGITLVITQTETGQQLYAHGQGAYAVPPDVYDIEIRTVIPSTTQVTVGPDETVPVVVAMDNGTIESVDLDGNSITGVTFVIKQAETGEQLYANGNGSWDVPPGTYDIEIRTLIRSNVQVMVGPGETVNVEVDTRTGTIVAVDENGNPVTGVTFVIKHTESGNQLYANANGSWDVPPGTYDIEVRTEERYTVSVTVTVPVTVNQ